MTATEVCDLAFKYVEDRFCDGSFAKQNVSSDDHNVFVDLVFVWIKNKFELICADLYMDESFQHEVPPVLPT